MDPEENLKEQLAIAKQLLECDHDGCICMHDAERLAALVEDLDEWIRGGGSLPQDWRIS